MREIFLEFAFRATYKLSAINYLEDPSSYYLFSISGMKKQNSSSDHSKDTGEQLLRVEPRNTKPWFADFEGDFENEQADGVYPCPNPQFFLMVTDSIAFYVNSEAPEDFKIIGDGMPIRQVLAYPAYNYLFLLSYTSMCAIGENGLHWSTKQLVRDELSILNVTRDSIFCRGNHGDEDVAELRMSDGAVLRGNMFTEQ